MGAIIQSINDNNSLLPFEAFLRLEKYAWTQIKSLAYQTNSELGNFGWPTNEGKLHLQCYTHFTAAASSHARFMRCYFWALHPTLQIPITVCVCCKKISCVKRLIK